MRALPVKNAAEALFLACEMERRAIRLYERAALLWPQEGLGAAISGMLADERRHLAAFADMASAAADNAPPDADALILAAHAAGILFEGGLTAAARAGAFDSPASLAAFAAGQERVAADCYRHFAQCGEGDVRAAFALIAKEEEGHLAALEAALAP